MFQVGGRFGLDVETLDVVLRGQIARQDHLQSNDAVGLDLASLENDAHAPARDLAQQFIVTKLTGLGRLARNIPTFIACGRGAANQGFGRIGLADAIRAYMHLLVLSGMNMLRTAHLVGASLGSGKHLHDRRFNRLCVVLIDSGSVNDGVAYWANASCGISRKGIATLRTRLTRHRHHHLAWTIPRPQGSRLCLDPHDYQLCGATKQFVPRAPILICPIRPTS